MAENAARPLAGMRIGLLTPWASRAGGGVFEAVVAQVEILRGLGASPVVIAPGGPGDAADRHRLEGAELHTPPRIGPALIGYCPGLARALRDARLDLLHLHGIWQYCSRAGSRWALATGRPYLISPHGMLDPWILLRGRWKKALARLGYERANCAAARAFHALTAREAGDIAQATGRGAGDCATIPNPAPLPFVRAGRMPGPEVVYIGRIHPKKNLSALVDGWAAARPGLPAGARLTIAGWGEPGDVAALRQQLAGADGGIGYIGPVFGQAKQDLIERARFVVLPSFSEGLPMAVLEAWAAGVPTLMTPECNLPQGFATGAAVECGYSAEGIAAALAGALAMSDADWTARSRAASELGAGAFSRELICRKWEGLYLRLLLPDQAHAADFNRAVAR